MEETQITTGDVTFLLAQAREQGASREVVERLEWLLNYTGHRSVSRTCRTFGIARSTFYRWARRFNPTSLKSLMDEPTVGEERLPLQLPSLPSPVSETPVVHAAPETADCALCAMRNWLGRRRYGVITLVVLLASLAANAIVLAAMLGRPTGPALFGAAPDIRCEAMQPLHTSAPDSPQTTEPTQWICTRTSQ